jgi:hypothetical protein
LSQDSAARGGPSKITVIAHSSGGLIARYYLSRQTEDRFGTRYRGNVARVIFLGTPHQGVDVENILDPLPNNLTYGLMIRFHYLFPLDYQEQAESVRTRFRKLRKGAWRDWRRDEDRAEEMPAFRQLHPGSELLSEINRSGAMPQDIEYINIVGDIQAGICVQVGKRILINKRKDLGDFLVTAGSAGIIPNAFSNCFSITADYRIDVELHRRAKQIFCLTRSPGPIPIHRHLRRHPAVQRKVLELLGQNHEFVETIANERPLVK